MYDRAGHVRHVATGQKQNCLEAQENSSRFSVRKLGHPRRPKSNGLVFGLRDASLHELFLLSLQTMKKLTPTSPSLDANGSKRSRTAAANLSVRCLSFDFLGTNPDDAEETIGATQIPTSWRGDICESLGTLFSLYMKWSPPETQPLMESIGLLAACRKSLFPEEDRKTFVQHLLRGLTDVCQTTHALSDEGTFHELTRFMARLTIPLSELDQFSGFSLWLDNMVRLTLTAFSPATSSTAITNLLQYWSRILGNNSNVGTKNTEKMRQVTNAFVNRFIEQRLEGNEFDEDSVGQDEAQLEYFAVIARFSYKSAVDSLVAVLEREATGPGDAARTAWLLLMSSFFISSRQPYGVYSDEDDASDGTLATTVFQVMQTPKSGAAAVSLSFLKFLDSLRRLVTSCNRVSVLSRV
jgi:exportin-7